MQFKNVTRRPQARRRAWLRNATLLLLVAGCILALTANLWLPLIGHWLAEPATLHPADAIVVHGGSRGRTLYGIQLYDQGLAPELWHTGYAYHQPEITTTVTQHGVSASAFHWLSTESTWDDGQQIVAFSRQRKVHSILVVTDWWHSHRALCSIRSHMNDHEFVVYFAPSPAGASGPDTWWQSASSRRNVLSELLKFGYYAIRYGMNPWTCS